MLFLSIQKNPTSSLGSCLPLLYSISCSLYMIRNPTTSINDYISSLHRLYLLSLLTYVVRHKAGCSTIAQIGPALEILGFISDSSQLPGLKGSILPGSLPLHIENTIQSVYSVVAYMFSALTNHIFYFALLSLSLSFQICNVSRA